MPRPALSAIRPEPATPFQRLSARARAALLQHIEAMAVEKSEEHWAVLPPDLGKRQRAQVTRIGDAFLTRLGTSDALRMNRVTGFGHLGKAEAPMVDEIIAWYRAGRLERFSVELGPGPQEEAIARWLGARGMVESGGTVLLVRDMRLAVPAAPRGVRVVRATHAQIPIAVEILGTAFASPPSRRSWALAGARAEGLEQYMGFVGDIPAGVGVLRVDRDLAWMGGGATLTHWRRRGVHAALIIARLRRAARAGARWAWVETSVPVPGRPDGSRRNLLKLGFEQVCEKRRFVWSEGWS